MTNPEQHRGWISRVRLGAASAALTFTVLLGLGVVPNQSAQAQNFTVLHNFTGHQHDGRNPFAALVQDASGNFYGTTYEGGNSACSDNLGCGTVFKVDTSDRETVLYTFTGGSDGGTPVGSFEIQDSVGNLYGTTNYGGASQCGSGRGCGVVFELDSNGKETVLHSFTGGTTDGCNPGGRLLRNKRGISSAPHLQMWRCWLRSGVQAE